MPWKETHKMDERKKFVTRLLDGDKMTDVCHDFGISRKTGYKIYERYIEYGQAGLEDGSRRPRRLANLLDSGVAEIILKLKREKPTWGAPKLRELLVRKYSDLNPPAISTIHSLLDRNGLVKSRKNQRRFKATGTYLSSPTQPNHLWCTDFKGQFQMGNQLYCYPLTITDQVSRYILGIEAMERINEVEVFAAFKHVFREFGLPDGMRSDNGVPFSSRGLFGLSKLSVWWLKLGIKLERIQPGKPQQNGRHERMHKTLKLSVTKPPARNLLSQQEKFNFFSEEFNHERPHEALQMKTPSQVYKKSVREYPKLIPELSYPMHDQKLLVTQCGTIRLKNSQRVFISETLGGQYLGLNQVADEIWQLSFMDYELGFFDTETYKFAPAINPFSIH